MKAVGHFLSYLLLRLMVGAFWLIPFPALYLLSDLLGFILKNIFKYRLNVIEKNIRYIFPSKSDKWVADTISEYYSYFIDLILETLKGMSMSPYKLRHRFKFTNPEFLNAYCEEGRHVFIYAQHLNNWEWAAMCLGVQMDHHLVGVVKKLSNPYTNNYIQNSRSSFNVSVVHTNRVGRYLSTLTQKSKPEGIVFIADQRPSGREKKVAVSFFNKQIDFHSGAANYALHTNIPLIDFKVTKIKRGYYEMEAILLGYANDFNSAQEITQTYVSYLEKLIEETPALWLWSHKRFKHEINY